MLSSLNSLGKMFNNVYRPNFSIFFILNFQDLDETIHFHLTHHQIVSIFIDLGHFNIHEKNEHIHLYVIIV